MVDACKGLLVLVLASIYASPLNLGSQDENVDVLLMFMFGREHLVVVKSLFHLYVMSYLTVQQLEIVRMNIGWHLMFRSQIPMFLSRHVN